MKLSNVKLAEDLHYGKYLLSYWALDISVRMVHYRQLSVMFVRVWRCFIRIVRSYLRYCSLAISILVLNAPPCINYGRHMWSCCYDMFTMAVRESRSAVRDSQLAYNQPAGLCMHALQSEGKIILIYSYFEIRVYFHPYYNMTLGFRPLGLAVVLF